MISRRTLFSAGTAASVASLLRPAASALAAAQTGPSASIAGVLAVTHNSDPGFSRQLNKLFPALSSDPAFQSIRSQAVLVTNNSSHIVSAYSTRWNVIAPGSQSETLVRHYFHPSTKIVRTVKFGVKGNQTRFTGKLPLLAPGESRLLTPYFNWSPGYLKAKHPPSVSRALSATLKRQFSLRELANATSVQVSIDAVLIDNHQVLGTDQANLGRVFRVTRNAEHDEANAISKLIASGNTPEQIANVLYQHATNTLPSRTDAFYHLYESVRKRQAKILLRRLQLAKWPQFLRTVQYLKRQAKTSTVPTSTI